MLILAAISTAMTFAGSLAFQITPSIIGIPSGYISHRGAKHISAAAARDDDHGDWYIGEGDDQSTVFLQTTESTTGPDDNIRSYFATCIPGLQDTLASELIGLGAFRVETQGKSGVRFEGTPIIGLKSILWCRTAHKIMELIASSSDHQSEHYEFGYHNDFSKGIRNRDDLMEFTKSAVHTPSLLGDGSGGLLTLSVSTVYASKVPKELCHSHFTSLTIKNALVDAVRDLRDDGERPNVDVEDSDVPLVVFLKGRRVEYGNNQQNGRDRRGSYGSIYDEDEEVVADVDLYRCLHSGGSLHRRGYRIDNLDSSLNDDEDDDNQWGGGENNRHRHQGHNNAEAPIHRAAMKETLAAGLLLEAGFDKLIAAARSDGKGATLVDPMTGSGTLPTEAAMIACDMAPGLSRIASWRGNDDGRRKNPHRYPPCVRWKNFSNAKVWDDLLSDATQRAKSGMKWACSSSEYVQKNVKILCNEKNPRAVSLAKSSIRNSGVGAIVSLIEGDCIDWALGGEGSTNVRQVGVGRTIFVCNPPWGLRLTEDIDESWVSLREFLRREAHGCESWVLSGNKDLTKILRMKKSRSVVVKTADEDLRWLQYHIFQRREVSAQ